MHFSGGSSMRLSAHLVLVILVAPGVGAAAAQAKSQEEYLAELHQAHFRPWHFNPWDAVLHPIDYWLKHTREERKAVRHKIWDFVKGREFVPEGFHPVTVQAGD